MFFGLVLYFTEKLHCFIPEGQKVSGTEAVAVAAEGLCGYLNAEDSLPSDVTSQKTEAVLQPGLSFCALLSYLS